MTSKNSNEFAELSYFPELLPDELLYSALGRYKRRMRYSSGDYGAQDLFGNRGASAVVDLPSHLDHLVSKLPLGHQYTADQLIDKHTLLPFYSPFLPPERVMKIRTGMKEAGGLTIHSLAGIVPSRIRVPNWLRFCPLCLEDDKKRYGEIYWHRLHQLPGVEVCPLHQAFLENSNAPARNRTQQNTFISAREAVDNRPVRALDLSNLSHQVLLKIAQEADWLLNQPCLTFEPSDLSEKYLILLTASRFTSINGVVSTSDFQKCFLEFYPSEVLQLLQCHPAEKGRSPWLGMILTDLKRNKMHHPLRHLLICQFLSCKLDDFFKISLRPQEIVKPFGEGPWPCLDVTSDHYKQLTIKVCRIWRNPDTARPTGKFTCSCGFSYSRRGPDLDEQAIYRYERTLGFSQSWDHRLIELWDNPSLSVEKISAHLQASPTTVVKQAHRLNLSFPRLAHGTNTVEGNAKYLVRFKQKHQNFQETQAIYRNQWLALRENHSTLTRKQLRNLDVNLFDWLYRNDREWFEDNLPSPHKRVGTTRKKDWESYDEQLKLEVLAESERIKNLPGRPVKVTPGLISSRLDRRLAKRDLEKLPETAKVLSDVTETSEDFAVRRIYWSAEQFRKEGICPSQNQLLLRVSLQNPKTHPRTPKIQKAIDLALQACASIIASN
ncbi:TnsD family Tn7-like transposition protein [Phormidesmis sp. 146-33]